MKILITGAAGFIGSHLELDVGFKPQTSVEEGIERFVEWYIDYHKY